LLHKGEGIKIGGPEALVAAKPFDRLLHRLRRDTAGHHAPGLFANDEARIRQHVEMFHDRGQRHRKRRGQRAHGEHVGTSEPRQQRPSRRVRERCEGAVKCGISILNHVV
jgi:hypothetical protein